MKAIPTFFVISLVVFGPACGGATPPVETTPSEETPAHAAGHPHAHHQADHHAHRHAHHGQGANHDFSDVEGFAAIFDDPDRDTWQKPAEVIEAMNLAPGMEVADLGAGTGYFLARLSEAVGPEGRVVGLDTEEGMVEHMQTRIREEQLTNADTQLVAPDEPSLDEGSFDRILIVDTWHHIGDRPAYAARLRDALRAGGQVIVVDFTMDSEHGPPAEMRLPPRVVMDELRRGGFDAELVEESLPNQYIIVASVRRTVAGSTNDAAGDGQDE